VPLAIAANVIGLQGQRGTQKRGTLSPRMQVLQGRLPAAIASLSEPKKIL
jgi:hypothetical protein